MSEWQTFKDLFDKSSLDNIYRQRIVFSGAAGLDKINQQSFGKQSNKQLDIISTKAIGGRYSFTKFKLKLISKGRGKKPREISIPTIRDRIALRALCDFLSDSFEEAIEFDLPQHIIKNVKSELETGKYSGFIKLDIKNFYPDIDHEILMDRLKTKTSRPEILKIIESSITTPTVERPKGDDSANEKGVPQGLATSNILAAIYLAAIDGEIKKQDYAYFRYVDDILILCDNDKSTDIAHYVTDVFKKIKLTVHEPGSDSEKSIIGVIDNDPFTYLGYKFLPDKVTVREASIERLRGSLTSSFTAYKYSKNKDMNFLLWRLNLRITGCIFENKRKGWLFFFSEITDIELLHRLDHFLKILCGRFEVKIKPKSFVRSYYQLKHKIYETNYVPNFDNYSAGEMEKVLVDYFGYQNIGKMGHGEIEFHFRKKVSRQVRELDTDLQDFGY